MVTQRSSWSWMIDSHPFRSTSIGPHIPEVFSNFDLENPKLRSSQTKVMGVIKRQAHIIDYNHDLRPRSWKGHPVHFPISQTYLFCPKYPRGCTPVRISRDVPPFRPPFSPQVHPLVGYSVVKYTPVGYYFFFLSHSLWVIFVKFSYLGTLLGSFLWKFDTPVGVRFTPRIFW